MSKAKLITLTTIVILAQAVAAGALYYYVSEIVLPVQSSADTVSENEAPAAEVSPAELEKQAEAETLTNPSEASEKYQQASELYENEGNETKAAEAAANADSVSFGVGNNENTNAPAIDSSARP